MRILLSYHYFRGDIDELFARYFTEPYPETFADSGAFSALTQNAVIDVNEYGRWLKRYGHRFAVRANLDVIGGGDNAAQAGWDNQQRLEDITQAYVLPVFHAGEDWRWLDHYLERGYPYIALGGLVGKQTRDLMPWLVRCFKTAAETGARFHGFGLTHDEALKALPFYSVDSSSWGGGYRYGSVRLFDDRTGKFQTVNVNDHRRVFSPDNIRLFRAHGQNPKKFAARGHYTREDMCALGAISWSRYEQWLRRRHGPVYLNIDTDHVQPGLIGYLADGSPQNLADGITGLKLYASSSLNPNDLARSVAGLKLYMASANARYLALGVEAEGKEP